MAILAVRTLVIRVVAAATALAAGGAWAQGDWDDLRPPEYSETDMAMMGELLSLSEDQRLLVQAFFEEYRRACGELRDEARAEIEFFREQFQLARETDRIDRGALFQRVQAQMTTFRERHEALDTGFIDDAQLLLDDDQMARWPSFERAMRRNNLLRRGEIAGEGVDLFHIADEAELSEESRAAIAPLLEDYAVQLDYALRARDSIFEEGDDDDDDARERIARALFRGEMEADDALRMARQERALRTRVRDININHAAMITLEIPVPEEAAAFERAFKERAFDDIYEENHAQRVFEAALELENLEEGTREAVENLFTTYELQREQMNRRLEALVLSEEPREFKGRMSRTLARVEERMGGRGGRGEDDWDDDVLDDAFDDLEEFEADMIARLHTLLSEEQIRALPRQERRRWD